MTLIANLQDCLYHRTIDPERIPEMTDASPAPPDEQVCEVPDLLSTVMPSVSNRVDGQTEVLDPGKKMAAEVRQA
jgi:hypothetical protein